MTTENHAPESPHGAPKHTPASMRKAIGDTDAKVRAAVQAVLDGAGLTGVQVHSVNFSIAPNAMSASGCENCDLSTHDCVLTPNGYVCLPAS